MSKPIRTIDMTLRDEIINLIHEAQDAHERDGKHHPSCFIYADKIIKVITESFHGVFSRDFKR